MKNHPLFIVNKDAMMSLIRFFFFYFRQKDIGLVTYEIKDLFVRLLTPTFFVIITVLQIHYFHKDFLEVTNIDRLGFVKK